MTLKNKVKPEAAETREHAYPEVLDVIDLDARRRASMEKAIARGIAPDVAASLYPTSDQP